MYLRKKQLLCHIEQQCEVQGRVINSESSILFFFFFFVFFRASPEAYESSLVRGRIGAVAAAGLYHSHSNTRSELTMQTTPQLMSTPYP